MVTDEPRLPVKVTVRAARAEGSVEAARRREAADEGSFIGLCGGAAQAVIQHSMSADNVKLSNKSGRAAKREPRGSGRLQRGVRVEREWSCGFSEGELAVIRGRRTQNGASVSGSPVRREN